MICAALAAVALAIPDVKPIPLAHAHNDYRHERPLMDALDNGFCSVEADIFLVEGELRVGHDLADTKPGVTLQKLYLDPLKERIDANGGSVYPGLKEPFQLLIDVKADGAAVCAELAKALEPYRPLLVQAPEGSSILDLAKQTAPTGAVWIVISGDRPDIPYGISPSFLHRDGRVDDLRFQRGPIGTPLISDNFQNLFTWRGEGPMPENERTRLRLYVQKARFGGQKLRFWAHPDTPAAWRELLDAGVDYINTDKLQEFREFMDGYRAVN